MNASLPNPDYATETEFRWPWWKFRLPPDALFTSLHNRFNTRPTAIQDPSAFHRDVVSCADESATAEEFYDNLSARRDQRIREISDAWGETSCLLGGTPALWSHCYAAGDEHDGDAGKDCSVHRWRAFVQFCRSMSFDRMVMFFDEYASEERKRQQTEREEARKTLERLCPLQPCTSMAGDEAKDSDPLHDSASDSEPNTAAEANTTVIDAKNLDHHPDVGSTNLPSPRSVSSSPVNTQKTRKRGRGNAYAGHEDEDQLAGSSARRPKRRRGLAGAVDEAQSSSVKGTKPDSVGTGTPKRYSSGSRDFLPVSPESSHDETELQPPKHADRSLLPPASPSTSHERKSVVDQQLTTASTSTPSQHQRHDPARET
ncbi:hypothetical protein K4K58_010812 [Colletotrichum sp. SAR11_239]|nr:hypothetical protein K4K58_010812 [Colletotrichum sp. SAR11_239]